MKHIVSFSGGMGSFAEALFCTERYGPNNVILLFADTLTEDPDLYRFRNECCEYLGTKLVVLSRGETVWQLFKRRQFIGNTRVDICSDFLKRKLLNEYIKSNYTHEQCQIHLGIDYSEKHRLENLQQYVKPYIYIVQY